jgi:hypothetical protein
MTYPPDISFPDITHTDKSTFVSYFCCLNMHNPPDILSLAYKQNLMVDQMDLLQDRQQQIPGSVQYSIKRFRRNTQWSMEDMGMMVYHYQQKTPKENYLELRFCLSGNVYCRKKQTECDQCQFGESRNCVERIESVAFFFLPYILPSLSNQEKGIPYSPMIF